MRHRRWKTLLALIACAALTAACGGGGSEANTSDTFQGRGPITFATGKDDTGTYAPMVDAWNKAHPQEQVRMIELPASADGQRQQMVQNAQTKSDAFTVLNLDVVWTSEFAANRWISELPSNQFDMSKFVKPTVDTGSYRGRLYAIPFASDGAMLYYRKDLLSKAGVAAPPTTWAEMQQDCQKIQSLPEAAGTSCYAGQFDKYEGLTANFTEAVAGAGGTVVDNNTGTPEVNSPQAKQGLDFLVNGLRTGMIPKEALTYEETQSSQAYQDGKLVFDRHWSTEWPKVTATDGSSKVAGNVAVAPLPGLNRPGVSSLGGHDLAISAFGKNRATALDFVKWATSEQQQRLRLDAGALAPTLTDLYDDPALQAKYPYLSVLKQSVLGAQPRPKVVRYGEVTQAIQDEVYAALSGTKSTDQALADLQNRLTPLVKP